MRNQHWALSTHKTALTKSTRFLFCMTANIKLLSLSVVVVIVVVAVVVVVVVVLFPCKVLETQGHLTRKKQLLWIIFSPTFCQTIKTFGYTQRLSQVTIKFLFRDLACSQALGKKDYFGSFYFWEMAALAFHADSYQRYMVNGLHIYHTFSSTLIEPQSFTKASHLFTHSYTDGGCCHARRWEQFRVKSLAQQQTKREQDLNYQPFNYWTTQPTYWATVAPLNTNGLHLCCYMNVFLVAHWRKSSCQIATIVPLWAALNIHSH